MTKILKRLVAIPIIALVLAVPAVSVMSAPAHAATAKEEACKAINDGNGCDVQEAEGAINTTLSRVVDLFSVVVGVVAVIMIIAGGFKYVTSNGDSSQITSAKNTIIYAIVGLIIVAIAQILVRFVLTQTDVQ